MDDNDDGCKLGDIRMCRAVISILVKHIAGLGVDIAITQDHLNDLAGCVLHEAQCAEGHLHLIVVTPEQAREMGMAPVITH